MAQLKGNKTRFDQIPLEKSDKAYLLVSTSLTRPHFDHKIEEILGLLKNLKFIKIILIYVAEAYADDFWPLGYGVNEAKTIEERKSRAQKLLDLHPRLKPLLAGVFVDNLNNDFAHVTGAWPESYIFAGKDGKLCYKSEILNDEGEIDIGDVFEYAKSNKWTTDEDKRRAQRYAALQQKLKSTDEFGLKTKIIS